MYVVFTVVCIIKHHHWPHRPTSVLYPTLVVVDQMQQDVEQYQQLFVGAQRATSSGFHLDPCEGETWKLKINFLWNCFSSEIWPKTSIVFAPNPLPLLLYVSRFSISCLVALFGHRLLQASQLSPRHLLLLAFLTEHNKEDNREWQWQLGKEA